MAVTNEQISAFLASNPGMSDVQIAEAMTQHGVTPAQMAAVTGLDVGAVQSRYEAATAPNLSQIANTSGMGAQGIGVSSPLTVEDLYQQYAGRSSDPSGLAYWTKDFGDTIDAREIDVFKQAVAEARAQGTEPAAGALTQATAPAITFTPGLASQTMDQKAAEYNSLIAQGFTDAQIRAAADATFGTQSATDWSALTNLAGQGAGATTGALDQTTTADTGLESNVITDYRGREYDTNTVLNLANQLAGIADTSQFSGGVFGVQKGSVGFDYDQAVKALGRDVSTAEQVLLDSARSLIDQGITDLSKLTTGDLKATVTVSQAVDENGLPTGEFYAAIPTGAYDDNGPVTTYRMLTPEEAARIRTEEITGTGDDAGSYTRRLLDDVATGERGILYDGRTLTGGNILGAGETYTGKGSTGYLITYDEQGKPRFVTEGRQSSALSTLAPLLQFASFIPGAQPFVLAANAAIAASQGNVIGALASLAGAGGYTNLATGLNVANAARTGDVGTLVGSLLSNPSVANMANTTMLTDTISLADLGNAANVVANIENKNLVGALNAASSLTNSADVKVAASAATILTELSKDNPNIGAIINATQVINNTTSTASKNVDANIVGSITNRVVDDLSTQGGGDLGSSTYISAVRAGATEEEALEAANAVTGATTGTGVVINAIPDAGPSNVVTTTYGQGGVDTNFGDLEGAIAARAIDDATRVERLDRISNQPKFADAYAQARSLLGPNQTFTWQGKEYSTATAEERPDLSAPRVQAATDESAAETARLARQNADLVTGNAPDQSAAETARLKSMEKTGFFQSLYKDLNDRFRLQGEAANKYLRDNPDSPITASVSSAFEAAGELQKNLGGVALALDNKPLADAIISGGSKLQNLGQSIGTAPEDTKNWNDTVDLINKASGTEKLAVLAGRIMDGTSGLARQVGLELRQEIPALFLGGGLLRPTMIASGLIDTADTGGAAVVDAYDNAVRDGKTHQEALSAGRMAGTAAAATEAAIQLTLGKLADVAGGKLDNVISKGSAKVAGEGAVEGAQEAGASAAVDVALGNAIDVNKALTQGVLGAAVGKGTAATTSPVDAATTSTAADAAVTNANVVSTNIASNIDTAIKSGDAQNVTAAISDSVTSSLNSGASTSVVVDSAITSAINGGADPAAAIDSTITSAVNSGAAVDLTIGSAISSAVNAGADVNTVIQAATNAATATGNNLSIAFDANTLTINNATTNSNTTVNTATGVTTTVDNNTGATTVVDGNTTTVVDANVTSQTKVDGNTQTTVTADTNTNTNTQTVVDANTNTTTSVTVDANNNTTTQTTINADTQTTVVTDINTNTQTTVKIDVNTGEVIDVKETEVPTDWTPPVIETPSVPGAPTTVTPDVEEDPAKKAARLRLPRKAGTTGGGGAGLPSSFDISGDPLRSRVTQGQIDPLARVKEAQAELEKEVMMNQIDPRLLSVMQQRMGIDQPNPQQQFDSDIGALAKMLRGDSAGPANEKQYYSYGSEDSIDDILGGKAANYAAGGYVEPLKASGGSMALPLLAKSGGALDKYHGRENFKEGKHVAGEGDGQSDDIPAWLADGEFVFPADVVSALGNGSTKAGTDKLYEMMHNIRDRARSKGPKDLPPPAFKSPLDYLKSSKRSTK